MRRLPALPRQARRMLAKEWTRPLSAATRRPHMRARPYQRGAASAPRRNYSDSFAGLLWRERGEDFLEARISAQGVPSRTYFELAVVHAVLYFSRSPQLFDGGIAVADGFINHG